jgi:hypothetical protein
MNAPSLKDLVLKWMPRLVSAHAFITHELGSDEVLMANGCCALLVFRDREGINVSVVLDRIREYPIGQYLVAKRKATAAVAAAESSSPGARAEGKVEGELAWYDRALSLCANDVLAGSVEWVSDYPGRPTTLAAPTRLTVGALLSRHPK